MNFEDRIQRLHYLQELLKKRERLSPLIIANKFECSDKTARRMINCLREKGWEIGWNPNLGTYLLHGSADNNVRG